MASNVFSILNLNAHLRRRIPTHKLGPFLVFLLHRIHPDSGPETIKKEINATELGSEANTSHIDERVCIDRALRQTCRHLCELKSLFGRLKRMMVPAANMHDLCFHEIYCFSSLYTLSRKNHYAQTRLITKIELHDQYRISNGKYESS